MDTPRLDAAGLIRVGATIRAEVAAVERVVATLREALARHAEPGPEVVVVHGTAGLIHDFYTGIEKLFRAVTPALNGLGPHGESWHRDLLRIATLDLPGIRPPILRSETAETLVEFLAFRHLYRNLYAFNLRWERVRQLAGQVDQVWPAVRADIDRFLAFLDAAAKA